MKTLERHQASSRVLGELLNLIDPLLFCSTYPRGSSLAGEALSLLLAGRTLTHSGLITITKFWRLSEPIRALRRIREWPVTTIEFPASTPDRPDRVTAKYVMPLWVLQELGALHV